MKPSRVTITFLLLVAWLGLGLGMAADSRANPGESEFEGHEQGKFTNADLFGGYAVQLNTAIWTSGSSPLKLEADAVGAVQFDGDGHVSGVLVVGIGGASESIPQIGCSGVLTGTYSLNPDGTGVFIDTVTYPPGTCASGSTTHSLALANHGKTVYLIVTAGANTSQIGTITLIKQ